jgi:hypothetical protein
MPSFLNIMAAGQKPVNEDWSRLAPTNAVNHSQYALWKTGLASAPSARDIKIKVPAIALTMRSIVIYQFSLIVDKFIIGKSYGYYTKPVMILLLIYPGGNAGAVAGPT